MEKVDYKKDFKDIYFPKKEPMLIDLKKMVYFMVDGKGDPNTSEEYKNALEILYGLSFTVKMSPKKNVNLEGYHEYTVFPLEGLWWSENDIFTKDGPTDKSAFCWTSMIRQPDFVSKEVFDWALSALKEKKPELDYSKLRYSELEEGKCAQIMHIGPYDDEPATVKKLTDFISDQGYTLDLNENRKHHEIYLGDPRKSKPENLKTVIRYPIK